MRYLYCFGYCTPEVEESNKRHGWDTEFSEAVFIDAASEQEALPWGEEISREFIRRLYGNQGMSWNAGEYAHWIESAPETRWNPKDLERLPIVKQGEHPALREPGFEERGTLEPT